MKTIHNPYQNNEETTIIFYGHIFPYVIKPSCTKSEAMGKYRQRKSLADEVRNNHA